MKIFFVVTLLISIVSVFYNFAEGIHVLAHNHFESRRYMLETREAEPRSSTSLGLTRKDLSLGSDYVAQAYKESVDDGYRAGHGYDMLSVEFTGLAALLFLTSIVGIRAVNKSRSNTKSASN